MAAQPDAEPVQQSEGEPQPSAGRNLERHDPEYLDREKLDFDPDDGLYSGTAVDGTTDIPGPHEHEEGAEPDAQGSEPDADNRSDATDGSSAVDAGDGGGAGRAGEGG